MTLQCMDTTHQTKILCTATQHSCRSGDEHEALCHSTYVASHLYFLIIDLRFSKSMYSSSNHDGVHNHGVLFVCGVLEKIHNLYVILDLFSECRLNLLSS